MAEHPDQFEPDDVAAALAPEPNEAARESYLLVGIPGPSREGTFKLFLDLGMTRSIEGSVDALHAFREIPRDQAPLGLKYIAVWLRADARLTYKRTTRTEGEPRVLEIDEFVPYDVLLWPPASPFGTSVGPRSPIGGAPNDLEGRCLPDPSSPTGYSQRITIPGAAVDTFRATLGIPKGTKYLANKGFSSPFRG